MTDSSFRISHAALVAVFFASPVFAAIDPAAGDRPHVDVERLNPAGAGNLLPFGPAPGTPPLGVQIGQDLDIYGLRTQYSF